MQGPKWSQGRRGWLGRPEAEGGDKHPGHGAMGSPAVAPWSTVVPVGSPRFLAVGAHRIPGKEQAGCRPPHPWEGDGRLDLQPRGAHCCLSTEHGAPALLPYQFHMEEIEGFRYRCRVSGQGSGLLWDGHPSSASVLTLCPSRTPCAR